MNATRLFALSTTALVLAFSAATQAADGPSAERRALVNRDVQQNIGYQESTEHMARVSQLLARALEEARQAEQAYALPGFSYADVRKDLTQIMNGIEPLLAPEKRRLRYQTLVPDGLYFKQAMPAARSGTADQGKSDGK